MFRISQRTRLITDLPEFCRICGDTMIDAQYPLAGWFWECVNYQVPNNGHDSFTLPGSVIRFDEATGKELRLGRATLTARQQAVFDKKKAF